MKFWEWYYNPFQMWKSHLLLIIAGISGWISMIYFMPWLLMLWLLGIVIAERTHDLYLNSKYPE
jgi:hypothetical protein